MPPIDNPFGIPDASAPEFTPFRADFSRLFIQHKVDLGMSAWSDEEIVAQTNDIMAALIATSRQAVLHADLAWFKRHRWFVGACDRLFDSQAAMPLDG